MTCELDPQMTIVVAGTRAADTWNVAQKLKTVGFRDIVQEQEFSRLLQFLYESPPDLLVLEAHQSPEACVQLVEDIRVDRGICNFPIAVILPHECSPETRQALASYGVSEVVEHATVVADLMRFLTRLVNDFDGSLAEAALSRAKASLRMANPEKAIGEFERAREHSVSIRTEIGLGQAHLMKGDHAQAGAWLEQAALIHPACFEILMVRLEIMLKKPAPDEEVLGWLQTAPLADLSSYRIPSLLRVFSRCERFQLGIQVAEQFRTSWEERNAVGFCVGLGHLYFDMGAEDEALRQLLRVQKLGSAGLEVLNMMGVIYAHRGEIELAVNYYEEALKVSPMDYRVLFNMALALERAGRLQEAVDKLQTVVEIAPGFQRARERAEELWRRLNHGTD